MRKIYFLIITLFSLLVLNQNVNGQLANAYIFSSSTGATLDPMTGATTVVNSGVDDAPSGLQNIGFTFNYEGIPFTQFSVSPDGFIRLGSNAAVDQFTNAIASTTNVPKIFPFWDDLAAGSNGSVSYVVTGTAPNRILVVNWFVTVPRNTTGAANSTMQAWLYETTNLIEFRYGAGAGPTASASIGINGVTPTNFISVTTPANTASTTTANNGNTLWPGSGTMYTFFPPPPCVPGSLSGGTLSVPSNPVCSGIPFTISVTGSSFGVGIGYQWQSSTDGVTFTDIPGATNEILTTSITSNTYFQRKITCSSSSALSDILFATIAPPVGTPFTEDFSTFATTFPPGCWARNNATFITGVAPSAFANGSGSVLFNFYNAAASTVLDFTSPSFTTVPAGYRVTFNYAYATFAGEVDQLLVLYSTDGGATFNDLASYDGGTSGPLNTGGASFGLFAPTAAQWGTKLLDLPAGTNRLLFRGISAFGNTLYLDNITVEPIPPCLPPTDLTATPNTQTTATLGWTASLSSPANGYQWEVRTSGAGGSGAAGLAAGGTTAAGVLTASVTGLTSNTTYSYYVRSDCGGGVFSTWVQGVTTFTTPCDPIAIPFRETFASYATTFPPMCWSANDAVFLTGQSPSANAIGVGSAKFDFYSADVGTTIDLVSPQFTAVPANFYLMFDHAYATFAFGGNDQLEILYSTNGGATYTSLIVYDGDATGPLNTGGAIFPAFSPAASEWASKIIALPAGTNRLLFRGISAFGNNLFLDNIAISSCLPPTALTVAATTQTTTTLNWTASASSPANGYEWEVRTSGAAGSGATGLVASGTTAAGVVTANVTGLTSNTTYTYYVRSNCGSDFSIWSAPFSFTTPCDPIAIPFNENFAAYQTDFPPLCWTRNNTTLLLGNAASGYGANAGSVLFDFYDAAAGTTLDLTSPQFTPVSGSYFLAFDHAYATFLDGAVDELQILYSTDGGITYTNLMTYAGGNSGPLNTGGASLAGFIPTASQWATKIIALPAGTNKLLFRGISAFGNNLYVDNIIITSCLLPTGLTVTATTQTTTTLSWTASVSSPANGYEWEVRTSGAAGSGATGLVASGTTTGAATTANVTGLTAFTTYSYYVRSACSGSDFSIWAGPYTFTTPCNPIGLPVFENFATYTTTFPPTCWNRNSTTLLLGQAPSAFGAGSGSALFDFYDAAAGTNIELLSPEFTPVSGSYFLTFDHAYATFLDGAVDQLQILYSTNGGATYTDLITYNGGNGGPLNTGGASLFPFAPTATQWATKVIALPAGTNKLLFRGISAFGNNLYLDNITVTSCLPPSGLTVTALAPTTASLSWTASSTAPANGYVWEVRTSGLGGSGAVGLVATGNTAAGVTAANVTGLTAYTTYSYYVRSNCSGSDLSTWAGPFTFTTPCDPISTPFSENFVNYISNFPPTCWLRNNTTLLAGDAPSAYGLSTGSAKFDFYNAAAGTVLELTSPLFTPVPANYGLTFDHAYATFIDEVDQLQILYSTDGGITYTNLITYDGGAGGPLNTGGTSFAAFVPTASQWATKVIILPAGTNRVLFRGTSAFGNNLYLDNISVSSCLPPTALTVTFAAQTTAALSWTGSISAPANGYQWEVRTSGVGGSGATGLVTSGTTAAGTTTATATGLTANTTYTYYVRSNCGSEFSVWGGPYSFTTPCDPISTPFIENFATYATTFPPNCWRRNNTTLLIGQAPSGYGVGSGSAKFDFYNASAGTVLELLSPQFNPVTGYFLAFDHAYATFSGENDQLQILYSTNAGATFTSLITYAGGTGGPLNTGGASFGPFAPTAAQWATKIIALPAGTNKLLFRGTSAFGNNLFVDNINITACVPPTGLTVTFAAQTTANLSWTASASSPANGYEWEVRSSGAPGSGATGLVTSGTTASGVTAVTATGLTAATTYRYYVRSNCGSEFSIWAGPFTFTTPCNPIGIPFIENFATYTTTFPPTCWTRTSTTLILGQAPSAYGVGAGSALFDFYDAAAGTTFDLVTPQFTAVAGNFFLAFDHAYATFAGENDQLQILYSTNAGLTYTSLVNYDGGTSGPLNTGGTVAPFPFAPTATQWATKIIALPAGTNKIIFRGTSAFGNNLYLDNILITSCLPPTGLTLSAIAPTAVTLSWIPSVSLPAGGYEWEVRSSGAPGSGPTGLVASGSTAAGTTTAGVTGLTAFTNYRYYVRSVCGGSDFSIWSSPYAFTTPCDPIAVPFTETFASTTFPPTCWLRNSTTLSVRQTASAYGIGSGSAKFDFYNAGAGTNIELTSPLFAPLPAGLGLVFDHAYATFSGENDQLEILYSTNGGATYTSLVTYNGGAGGPLNTGGASFAAFTPTAAQWSNKAVILPAGTNRLLFRGISAFGNNLYLDNIAIVTCLPPTSVSAIGISSTSAQVSFTSTVGSYIVEYGPVGFTPGTGATAGAGGTVVPGTSSPITVTGLTASTTYDFYVRSVCTPGSDYSVNVKTTATTLCAATTIPYVQNFESAVVPAIPTCTSIQTISGNPWTVQNNPGSGFTSKTLRYNWNTNLAANSWFYTQGITLTGGTSYRLTYRYGNNSTFFTENLKVAYGTGAVATAMTTTLADHLNIVGGSPSTNALDFTPPTTGVYYIGFQAHSDADQFYLFVDDINVKVTPLVDVGATGIIPVTCASANGVVRAIFRNFNLTTLNLATYPITVTGTLSGAASGTITATINTGTLAPGAYDTVSLSGFNFVAGTYNITVVTSSPDDPETANNSYTTSFVVNPLPVTATISPAAPQICVGNVIQLNAQFATSPRPLVSWSPATSLYINAAATLGYFGGDSLTVYAKPAITTTYTVTTTDRITGCTNTSTVTVIVNPLPPVTIAALPARICTSDEIIPLSATPVTGTWSGIGVLGNSFRPPLVAAVGTYTLSYTYTDPVTTCTTVATIAAKVEDCPERIILLRDNAVTIYPNPNNGQFNIKMNSVLYNKLMMRVYTNTGVLVRAQELNGLAYGRVVPMNLSYLPAGSYMIRFSYNGGPRTSEKTFKVIITH